MKKMWWYIPLVALLLGLFAVSDQPSAQAQSFSCNNVSEISYNECQALMSLYLNTDGYQWGARYHSTGWLRTNQPCQWGGVICENGHVTGLSLVLTGLRGPFPSEIGRLPYLRLLNLSDNNLHGSIPAWVGNLGQLQVLNLAGNLFSGTVPASLGNLQQLEMLALHNNYNLTGLLPLSLVNLANLENLTYYDTQLCAPIEDVGFLTWLLARPYVDENALICGPLERPQPEVEPEAIPEPYTGQVVNVIQNGSFELPGPEDIGVAQYWQRHDNGGAHFAWYDDQWEEVIFSGEHSQLMEIFEVYGPYNYRTMSIYQTVKVRPHSTYQLTMHLLMRSTALYGDRNKGEFAMDWGIDPWGRGDYNILSLENRWQPIFLLEQAYLGSHNPETGERAHYLTFKRVQTTIQTGDSEYITLFIRGVKKNPTQTEVNFNIDDVSLVGPPPY